MASERDGTALSLGVPEIDAEHTLQVERLEALRAALSGSGDESVEDLLAQLEDYTNAHFLAEQLLMRLHAYPAYESHVAEHDRLIEELRRLGRTAVGDANARLALADELERWLLEHIQTSDQALAAYLKETREGRP